MAITYKELREILIERKILRKKLKEATGLSNETIAKIDKDEYMNLESLEKIARYLEKDIGDIVKLKKET